MNLLTNTLFFIFLFLGLIVTLHLLLIRFFVLNKSQWLKMEYVVLSFGAIGIITTTADLRSMVMSNYYNLATYRTDTMYKLLLEGLEATESCINFVKSEYSPANFDQIQDEYNNVCKWTKELRGKLPPSVSPDYPSLDFKNYKPKFPIDYKPLIETIDTIKNSMSFYQKEREEMLSYKDKSTRNEFEELLYFLSPLFFAFALALQITKVTAERNELLK